MGSPWWGENVLDAETKPPAVLPISAHATQWVGECGGESSSLTGMRAVWPVGWWRQGAEPSADCPPSCPPSARLGFLGHLCHHFWIFRDFNVASVLPKLWVAFIGCPLGVINRT